MKPANRLAVLSALRWFPVGLVIPVLILMLGARGLPLDQVGMVMALYSVVTLSLELPTGGLADTWGRRRVLVVSGMVNAAALLLLGLSGQMGAIVIAIVALGVARALSSGPLEAWFVDALSGEDPRVEAGLARGQIAESLALGLGSIIGGFLPRLASGAPSQGSGFITLSVPFLWAAATTLVFVVCAAVLLNGEPKPQAAASVTFTVRAAARSALTEAPVRRVILVAAALGVVLSGVELLSPNRFNALLPDPAAVSGIYGVLTASAFAVAAAGAGLSTRIGGPRVRVGILAFLLMATAAISIAVPSVSAASAGFLLVYLAIGLQGPVMAGLLHARVESSVRATMVSVESLALQAGGAVTSLVVGAVAAGFGFVAGFAVVTVAALAAVALLVRDARSIPRTL
jgi:hypothetical protein